MMIIVAFLTIWFLCGLIALWRGYFACGDDPVSRGLALAVIFCGPLSLYIGLAAVFEDLPSTSWPKAKLQAINDWFTKPLWNKP